MNCCTPPRRGAAQATGARSPGERTPARAKPRDGMLRIPGGVFHMGYEGAEAVPGDGEGPVRAVRVRPFLMDRSAVTNAQFAAFVRETGYRTEAERFGWSFVFYAFLSPRAAGAVRLRVEATPWWCRTDGAHWGRPDGPDSSIRLRRDHPAVHISWHDAAAYCAWAEARLPTEAEWEFAARGGLAGAVFPWGDELTPGGEHLSNVWQGSFPDRNTADDGYAGTAPAVSYPPNGYGLYNMTGNVWEWCADWFSADWHATQAPPGNAAAQGSGGPCLEYPSGPGSGTDRVMRGGSYLCHRSYCNRYRVAARSHNTPDSATGNLGFRCVRDVAEPV